MPMGPITLYDVVGLDTAFYAGRVMYEAFPDRIVVLADCCPRWSRRAAWAKRRRWDFSSIKDQGRGEPDPTARRIDQAPYIAAAAEVHARADHGPAVPADAARSDANAGGQAGPRSCGTSIWV